MASSEVDQKWLGRCAQLASSTNPLLSRALYQILGLSTLLARKLYRARKLRKLDTSRDTKSLALYQHIIWLAREGLAILENDVLQFTMEGQYGPECRTLSAKLRASFYHIFCLFHNQPPVSNVTIPTYHAHQASSTDQQHLSPQAAANSRARAPALRDPVGSITSETSFLTNPYGTNLPNNATTPSPPHGTTPAAPPGLPPVPRVPQPSAFLLPPFNFLPITSAHFVTAVDIAASSLPGSHPLRLSVALEHCAWTWDCLHDHDGARKLAKRAIRDVYRAEEAMNDADFEEAAELVGLLGRIMKRKSWESTPKVGQGTPTERRETAEPSRADAEQALRDAVDPTWGGGGDQHGYWTGTGAVQPPSSHDYHHQSRPEGIRQGPLYDAPDNGGHRREKKEHNTNPTSRVSQHNRSGSGGSRAGAKAAAARPAAVQYPAVPVSASARNPPVVGGPTVFSTRPPVGGRF